jgi:hypothetical protein
MPTEHLSDSLASNDSFSAFETSEDLISAMDFYLPHSVDTTNSRCRTSYELEQCISGLFQPSLGYLDAAQLPELELNFGGKYPAQNDAALRQDILAQRATGDLHQASHSRTVSTHEISLPDPEVHDPIQPQLNIPMLTNSSSNSIDNSSNDQNNIGNPRPIICNNKEDNTIRGEELDPTDAKIEAGTLEARFEYVIRAVEKSGFESLDDMMTQYYTATFKEERILHWAQSRSRSRSLPTLLASLHENTRKWPDRDAHGYRQAILQSAEHIYLSELASARSNLEEDEQRHNPGEEKETSSVDEMLATSKDLWKVITELDENEHIRRKKAIIRDNVSVIKFSILSSPKANEVMGSDARDMVTSH